MRAGRVCSVPGCPTVSAQAGRCAGHQRQADQARGTAHERGYASAGHRRFRRDVLAREPACARCGAKATVADHWPLTKRQLQARGLDDHDPARGRGLCKHCHDRHTARTSPGGWNVR